MNSHPILEPWNLLEGGAWAAFWGISAWQAAESLRELNQINGGETEAADHCEKKSEAIKTAFANLINLFSTTTYNMRWLNDVKILPLGQYASLVNNLCYGSTFMINTVEGVWSAYTIYLEKEAIDSAGTLQECEKHKQHLFLSLMKIVGNICMIAWSVLGIITVSTGLVASPILTIPLLSLSAAIMISTFFYQRRIEEAPPMCPIQVMERA